MADPQALPNLQLAWLLLGDGLDGDGVGTVEQIVLLSRLETAVDVEVADSTW